MNHDSSQGREWNGRIFPGTGGDGAKASVILLMFRIAWLKNSWGLIPWAFAIRSILSHNESLGVNSAVPSENSRKTDPSCESVLTMLRRAFFVALLRAVLAFVVVVLVLMFSCRKREGHRGSA